MFVENGHKRTFLENLVKDYNAKKKNNDSRNYINWKKILWVPNIGPKIRKKFKKVNKDITFTSGKNLKNILCQNKPKPLPNSHPGVCQLDCSCSGRYTGKDISRDWWCDPFSLWKRGQDEKSFAFQLVQ